MQQLPKKKQKNRFIVEGNIGSGKSTFLSIMKNNLNIDVIFEPTDKWQKINNSQNLLNLFYKDMNRWSYTFQSYAFVTRVQSQLEKEKISRKNIIVSERSVYCDRFCFGKNCFERGVMSKLEWSLYKEWFSWIVKTCLTKPSGFIYLKTSPEICLTRLQKRLRNEESSITLDYLVSLHNKHECWLIEKKIEESFLANVPVLVLDCNKDFENDFTQRKILLEKTRTFINEQSIQKNIVNTNITKNDTTYYSVL
jgi:deoxyadenosine/deoxycytidine kinase